MTDITVFLQARSYQIINHFATFSLFKPVMKILIVLPLWCILSGCASYKLPTNGFLKNEPCSEDPAINQWKDQAEAKAAKHWLYQIIPRHKSQIRWYDLPHWTTWMLFGNDDEGIFGESTAKPYKLPWQNNFVKASSWWLRNPFHNFTHYTIGSAGSENSEFTLLNLNNHGITLCRLEKGAKHNFGSSNTSFYAGFHGGKPYLSLRILYPWKRKTECYIGWRNAGAFGLKFLPMISEEKHKRCFSIQQDSRINFPEK